MAQNGDVELLRLRARCLYFMGDVENSLKHLQQAVRSDPDNTGIRSYYRLIKEIEEKKSSGDSCFKAGNYQEAIDNYSSCIELTKDNKAFCSKLYLNRATAKSKLKLNEDAIKDCNLAINFNPEYLKAFMRRADCYLAVGGPEKIQHAIR